MLSFEDRIKDSLLSPTYSPWKQLERNRPQFEENWGPAKSFIPRDPCTVATMDLLDLQERGHLHSKKQDKGPGWLCQPPGFLRIWVSWDGEGTA